MLLAGLIAFSVILLPGCHSGPKIKAEIESPLVEFGLSECMKTLSTKDYSFRKIECIQDTSLGSQAYAISLMKGQRVRIKGGDEAGIMYGLLDMSDQIRFSDKLNKIKDSKGSPFIKRRGLKFNVPLDARTPSFDDTGDAAQNNIKTIWEIDFWEDFLDDMARYRYNTLTLWTPNPFPSMIKIPGMEEASLNDVYRCTLELTGEHGEWAEPTMVSSDVMQNLELIQSISIEEKIIFWQKVMEHAVHRGIDLYFITWNIAPNSVATPVEPFYKCWLWKEPLKENPGKYGVSHDIFNEQTIAYYRKAVKTFLQTYPDLKGIGVTSGEHMPRWLDDIEREKWLWNTYGMGVVDALEQNPNRKVDFIHRMWWTNMDNVMQYWENYPGTFDLSFKYSRARLYSHPKPVFADELKPILQKYGLKSWWNLRNDDIFLHRWGDPEFVRTLLTNFPHEQTAGYHMGSDGYVWARNSSDLVDPGQLEIKKHWYRFMLWGMLGYNPEMEDRYFVDAIHYRMPGMDAKQFFDTWKTASQIIPLVNRFHWVDWDFQWAVEGCFGQGVEEVYSPSQGFHTVEEFISTPTMAGMDLLNPRDYVKGFLLGAPSDKTTPLQVADQIQNLALESREGIEKLKDIPEGTDIHQTAKDILSMSSLGLYYAEKIRGSVALELYNQSYQKQHQQLSILHLEQAAEYWKEYANINRGRYKGQVLARPGKLDLDATLDLVREDIEIVRSK